MTKIVKKAHYSLNNMNWAKKLGNIKTTDGLWSVKKMVCSRNQTPVLSSDMGSNIYVFTDHEKAELLGNYFESVHK